MAQNYRQPGHQVTLEAPQIGTTDIGGLVVVGQLSGVLVSKVVGTNRGVLALEGVYYLTPKPTGISFTAGAAVHFDGTNLATAGGQFVGLATRAAGSADTGVEVKLERGAGGSGGGGGGDGLQSVASDATLTGNGTVGAPLRVANPFEAADETKLDGLANITSIGERLTLSSGVLSANEQDSGLTTVASDATLTGTGTTADPLKVANPFEAADETKLDGLANVTSIGDRLTLTGGVLSADVQSGGGSAASESTQAQAEAGSGGNDTRMTPRRVLQAVNKFRPRSLLPFSAQDGDTTPAVDLQSGDIGLYNADGTTQNQGGDVADVKVMYIAKDMGVYGTDITLPTTPRTGVNLENTVSLMLGGKPHLNALIAISQRGSSNIVWFWSDSVTAYGTGGWRFNLTHIKGSHTRTGEGYSWNIVLAYSVQVSRRDIIDGGDLVLTDGSNVTDALKSAIQGDNEEVTLPNTFRVNATNVDRYATFASSGGVNTATIRIPNTDTTNDADLKRLLHPASWVEFSQGNNLYRVAVTANATRATIGTSITFTFNYDVLVGSTPSGGSLWTIAVVGEDVHRGELVSQAFEEETPSIGGRGGSDWNYWRRRTGNDNATWQTPRSTIRAAGSTSNTLTTETAVRSAIDAIDTGDSLNKEDTVPFAAAFRQVHSRSIVASLTSATGEAVISDGNNVPSGAPSGTTDFLGVDKANASGTIETSLADVAAGDWFRVYDSSDAKYIIAKIQHVSESSDSSQWEYWFNPSTDIADTLAYDQLGTGAVEIRFYTKGGGGGLAGLTFKDEGVTLSTLGTSVDFTGAVMVTGTGEEKTVNVPGSALNYFDSGVQSESSSVNRSDTDAINMPAISETGVVTSEIIANFGRVYQFTACKTVTFNFRVNTTLGVGIRLRYSTTKPTASTDAKSFGTQAIQINNNNDGEWTGLDIASGTYFWLALSGGNNRTSTLRTIRIRASYELQLTEGDRVTAGTGITITGSNPKSIAVSNPFTAADETKLDGIAAGAEVNVQSDWNASSGDAQILNKPTIPAARLAGTGLSLSGNTLSVSNPFTDTDETKLDGLANITSVSSGLSLTSGALTVTIPVPSGGTTGQVLTRTATGYEWATPASGGGGSKKWKLLHSQTLTGFTPSVRDTGYDIPTSWNDAQPPVVGVTIGQDGFESSVITPPIQLLDVKRIYNLTAETTNSSSWTVSSTTRRRYVILTWNVVSSSGTVSETELAALGRDSSYNLLFATAESNFNSRSGAFKLWEMV